MGEGTNDNKFVKLFAEFCYAACIAIQLWAVVDMTTDGQAGETVKRWWKRIHAATVREAEIQRQYSHVLFESYQILEGTNGLGNSS